MQIDSFMELPKEKRPPDDIIWYGSQEDIDRARKAQLNQYALGRFYGDLGKREDVANMVVFLCSDRARWVTGQSISVSGGYHMHQ